MCRVPSHATYAATKVYLIDWHGFLTASISADRLPLGQYGEAMEDESEDVVFVS